MLWNTGEDKMIEGLLLSFQFFTRIPIKKEISLSNRNIKYSLFFLPLVGAVIGLIAGIIYHYISTYSVLVASLMALFSSIILTGGLHIDGLSDTFDGFMSNRDKEKTFEIMKDSRIGAFGVLSIVLLILFKYILIISLEDAFMPLVLSFINSRIVLSYIITSKKSAKEDGLGNLFKKSSSNVLFIVSLVIYLNTLFILIDPIYTIPLIITWLSSEYISHVSNKKIKGLTGDVYGSIIEIGEVVSLFGFWGVMIWM